MPPAAPGIRELAALLGAAGLDPSAEEVADALWLAGHMRPPPGARPAGDPPGREPAEEPPPAAPPREPVRPPAPPAEDPVGLYAPDGRAGSGTGAGPGAGAGAGEVPDALDGVPVRVPAAAALPRILDVQRALRALQRHRPPAPPGRAVLDEAATAEASARALGTVIPVFRRESRREATVRLVMDASPSMAVWQDMFEELRAVCERLGAFRDVQVYHLHRLADGSPAVGRGPLPGTATASGDQLRDPTGRALTMVVSDCAGPVWREGAAQRLLHRWAECTPCVVVQPLPQRLWNRSWLPTERGTLARVEGGAGKLRFRPDRPPRAGQRTGGLTVPVLPPNATALGAWARLVAGLGSGPVPAEVGRVLARHPAAPAPPPRAARPPRELVRRFRASAAPRAVQLAIYLSAAPLTLPVMRLVQRTMLPDSEPSDLAEVLLGGLLRRTSEAGWYAFVPGVQDVLLGPLGRDEAALVLKHCSEYVLAHFGRGVRNFPALAVSQLTGVPAPAEDVGDRVAAGRLPQAFAQVSAKVVRRYLPGPPPEGPAVAASSPSPPPGRDQALRTARERLAAHDRGVDARGRRPLYEAVAVLRRAVSTPAGPGERPGEAETELAGALLRLWTLQRDPELLGEAERALAGLRDPAARAARGRVLYERALAGEPDAGLLAAAEREFAAAGAAADLAPGERVDCAVRRADALVRLSGLREDPQPLREARAALEALEALGAAEGSTGPDPRIGGDAGAGAGAGAGAAGGAGGDPAVRLALGRVLAALLAHTPDPDARAELAARAADRLIVDPAAGPGARARVRVELATALRYLPARLEEAAGQVESALAEAAGDPELRVRALLCLARVHRARHARDGDPAALEDAAGAYSRARRLVPRDGDAFGELLPEWGEVLLARAGPGEADGPAFVSTAVRVLRESRAAVPQSDPRAARRLVRLAAGLRLRHAYEGDLVDLREAEYLLELAVRQSHDPLEQAGAWRDHGDVQRQMHAQTRALDRLDRAAESYRRAWRVAVEADAELAARVQELRGEVLERLARPRAALDAYRSALELWTRLGAVAPAAALRERIRALEPRL
ncbi:SAV_2336 N-terminal domain-related protein [Streptomyces sp. NPDC091268]|uniref:SAV_2336 N-terminal domain-related protein n=1 Tax=Streptomyces sp. NPDC091268 TaxID=3365979 RepID=UPI003823A386